MRMLKRQVITHQNVGAKSLIFRNISRTGRVKKNLDRFDVFSQLFSFFSAQRKIFVRPRFLLQKFTLVGFRIVFPSIFSSRLRINRPILDTCLRGAKPLQNMIRYFKTQKIQKKNLKTLKSIHRLNKKISFINIEQGPSAHPFHLSPPVKWQSSNIIFKKFLKSLKNKN